MQHVSPLSAGPHFIFAAASDFSAIVAFSIYILLVFFLAILSNRYRQSNNKSFLAEYFLGSRTLGVWAFALTFAATSASGGSFMGFPSLVYTHGWVLAMWIAGYMLVPIVAIGLLGKRINQFSRKTDAITIPDMLRGRFQDPMIGVVATYFIVFFMVFNLVAQFKAGSKILQTLMSGIPFFDSTVLMISQVTNSLGLGLDPAYVLCLLVFGLVVVAYTTYGGFRAVVWTDVLQGFFMVAGVLFMLPVTIWAVGGMGEATRLMATMQPPIELSLEVTQADSKIPKNSWLHERVLHSGLPEDDFNHFPLQKRLFRVKQSGDFDPSERPYTISVIEIVDQNSEFIDSLPIFRKANGSLGLVQPVELQTEPQVGKYVSLPGFKKPQSNQAYLPIALAVSFFFFWTFSSAGQPSNMVRLMAFRDSKTLKRAIFTVCVYYSLIYFPIVMIFCCARVLMPGWETDSDRIMPEMAKFLTMMIEMPWLAGILVAAPFAAVMSTMDSFLLMISSSIVRDIYQKKYPDASAQRIKSVTYWTTIIVGIFAMLAAMNPPRYLQDLIIFTGGGLSTTFLAPMALSLYWKRMNASGAISGMVAGFLYHGLAYLVGTQLTGQFSAYYLAGFDPFVPGSIISLMTCIVVARLTQPPSDAIVIKFFYRKKKSN